MASETADEAPRGVAAAIFVAALIALVYAGPILSGERFYFRDVSQNHGPAIEAARTMLRAGHAPWWNPWAGGGEPLFANPNHVLFVPEGLFGLVLGAGHGLTVAALAGTLLAGLFVFLLLRDMGRSPWAASGGALAFALSGVVLSAGSLPNVMAAVSWIPAALFLVRRALGRPRWLPAASIAVALVVAPCEPASAIVLCGFLIALAGWRSLGILALGVGIAAVQVFPSVLWIASSARSASGLAPADATKWALVLKRLPELLVPGFIGRPELAGSSEYWGSGLFQTGLPFFLSVHVGGAVLLLALFGLRAAPGTEDAAVGVPPPARPRRGLRTETTLALLGSSFLLLALIATPARLAGFVPGAGLFRYPEKFMLGAVLAIALLTASGAERLLSGRPEHTAGTMPPGERARRASVPGNGGRAASWFHVPANFLALLACTLGAILTLVALPAASWFVTTVFGAIPGSVAGAAGTAGLPVPFALGALELFLLALAILGTSGERIRLRGVAVTATVGSGLLLASLLPGPGPVPWRLRANPSVAASFYEARPFFEERLKAAAAAGERVFRFDRPAGFAVLNRTGTLADGHLWDRRSLGRSSASEFGVALAYDRSTDRLDPAGQDAALAFFSGRPSGIQARFWSLASVRWVFAYAPLDAPGLTLVDRVEGESNIPLLLYENAGCLPRARMTSSLRSYPVDSDDQARARIADAADEDWMEPQIQNYRGIHVAPADLPRTHMSVLPPIATGREAAVVETRPGRLTIRVGAAGEAAPGAADALRRPENLVIAENDVPGWTATLDGREVRISRADGMHLSLVVPDGAAHEVVLSYTPPGLLAGVAISALALLLVVVRAVRDPRRGAPVPA